MCLYDFIIPRSHLQWGSSPPCFLINCNCLRHSANLLSVNISIPQSPTQKANPLTALTVHIFWMKMEFMPRLAQCSMKLNKLLFHPLTSESFYACSLLPTAEIANIFHTKHTLSFINPMNILWYLNLISSISLFMSIYT